jgi:hypothetical protein
MHRNFERTASSSFRNEEPPRTRVCDSLNENPGRPIVASLGVGHRSEGCMALLFVDGSRTSICTTVRGHLDHGRLAHVRSGLDFSSRGACIIPHLQGCLRTACRLPKSPNATPLSNIDFFESPYQTFIRPRAPRNRVHKP